MISWVTIVWSAVASACLTLAVVHLLIGLRQRERANLLFAVNSLSIAAIAAFELALMRASSPAELGDLIRWIHVPIFLLVTSLVLFVRAFFRAGSAWLAAAAIASRAAALLVNFLRQPNLNYLEITSLRRVPFLGEDVSVAAGTVSGWTRLGELSSVLLLAFLLSAAVSVWRRGERARAAIVGGSILLFVLGGAGHAALVHSGVVALPYMFSVAYLGVVVAMGYELTSDVLRASALARALRESQDDLRESDRQRTVAADVAKLGFWAWDPGTNEMWMTQTGRSLRGFPPEERLDLSRFLSSVHAEDRESLRRLIETAAGRPGPFEREYRIVRPDGETRWVALHGERDQHDGRDRVRGVSIDVTRQKTAELESQRRQSEVAHLSRVTALGELSGSLAHEINQPLTAILSNTETIQNLLGQEGASLPEVQEILADIVHEGRHAAEVIQRFRLLLRKGEVRPEALEMPVLVDDVVRLVRGDLAHHGVTVSAELPAELPLVRGDRVQVEQVLLNLLTNACDAMADVDPQDRRLVLGAVAEDGEVRVSVRDRGPGIAPSDLERVFEPFVTSKSRGLGLGLSVCRSIVTAHDGRLWAVNNEDRGATFHFTLPVAGGAPR